LEPADESSSRARPDVALYAQPGIRVEAPAAIEIAHQPLAKIHDLYPALSFMPKLEVPVLASLQRATELYPARPFVQRLSGELPGDQRHVGWTRLQLQCGVHNRLRNNESCGLTTPGPGKSWRSCRDSRCDSLILPMRLWDRYPGLNGQSFQSHCGAAMDTRGQARASQICRKETRATAPLPRSGRTGSCVPPRCG